VHQHAEVAEFLGDLVGGGDEPGDDTDADVDDEGPADGEPTDQVVQTVGEQDQVAERSMVVWFVW
jgi:hypothetical protein